MSAEKREPIESAITGRLAILRAARVGLSRLEHRVLAAVLYMLPLMQKREGAMFIGQVAAIAYGVDHAEDWQIRKTGTALRHLHELGVLVRYEPARGGKRSFLGLGNVPEPGTIVDGAKVPDFRTEMFPNPEPKRSRSRNPNPPCFGVPTEGRSPKSFSEGGASPADAPGGAYGVAPANPSVVMTRLVMKLEQEGFTTSNGAEVAAFLAERVGQPHVWRVLDAFDADTIEAEDVEGMGVGAVFFTLSENEDLKDVHDHLVTHHKDEMVKLIGGVEL